MSGNTSPARSSVISPLPPPPPPSRRGYLWTAILVGIVLVFMLILVALGWYTIPGLDPVRASAWYFATVLLIVIPAHVVVYLLSCGFVALIRAAGGRRWPGILQAAPAVTLVIGSIYLLGRWLFSGPDLG